MEIKKIELHEAAENESDFFHSPARIRQSQLAVIQNNWNGKVVAALAVASKVNPYKSDIPVGTVVPAIDAVDWQVANCDVRPRLIDKSTGESASWIQGR